MGYIIKEVKTGFIDGVYFDVIESTLSGYKEDYPKGDFRAITVSKGYRMPEGSASSRLFKFMDDYKELD